MPANALEHFLLAHPVSVSEREAEKSLKPDINFWPNCSSSSSSSLSLLSERRGNKIF